MIVKGKHQIIMKLINDDLCSCFRDPVLGRTDFANSLLHLRAS